jgi:hypothetical protein
LEQKGWKTVVPSMNRGRFAALAITALVAVCACSSAQAKDDPKPSLSFDPIVARSLLAPVEDASSPTAAYRLDPLGQAAVGQRARLSIDVGDATLFAITGKLNRQRAPAGPLDGSHARALGQRRDGGKVYGVGVTHNVRGIDLGATYQYSKVSAEQADTDSRLRDDGPGKSHSLRATARIRFRL